MANTNNPIFGVADERFSSRGSALNNPFPLIDWCRNKKLHPPKTMRWQDACWDQIIFVRDVLARLLLHQYSHKDQEQRTLVVGHHLSKSIQLPVYEIRRDDCVVLVRNNFHDWKVSVESQSPVALDISKQPLVFPNLDVNINPIYCEGFPTSRVYPCFMASNADEDGPCCFTVEFASRYSLYVFLWLLLQSLENPGTLSV